MGSRGAGARRRRTSSRRCALRRQGISYPVRQHLCDGERREREARNLARRAKLAALGSPKPLDRFDWNHPRAIERHLFESLYDSLDFVDRGENVLLRGQAGVGKTTLAQHLGLRALERGLTVRFSTLPAALADLLRQESLPATERRLRRYVTPVGPRTGS